MKVDFLIVGAQKSGSTALDQYLRGHSQVEMAKRKEVHFFDDESIFTSTVDYSRYHNWFENKSNKTKKGEATPIYMYWHEAPKRIWEYNPKMKLIVILRNPIDRAFSHWNMARYNNMDTLPFSEAIRTETERYQKDLSQEHRWLSYIDRGFYTKQLKNLWQYFPKNQTLILKYESLKFELSNTLYKVSEFLDIEEFEDIKYRDVFSTEYISTMSEYDYKYLHAVFLDDIMELESMLGWNCGDWIKRQ